MSDASLTIALPDEDETVCLAQVLAPHLGAGDVLLLEGPIGAGKTHFCRALIRARLGHQEEVPSPTFTLVQTYGADPEIWHSDLYRLTHPDEAWELGLDDAFREAICLVEWPDRLGKSAPPDALRLRFAPEGAGRNVTLQLGRRADLGPVLQAAFPQGAGARSPERLLTRAGWQRAERLALAGDASARRYFRLALGGETRILMDNPPGIADDIRAFVRIDAHLRGLGLSAPIIHDQDLEAGFLLLEDLGDGILARLLAQEPAREGAFYRAATDVLLHLQASPPPEGLPNLSATEWAQAAMLAVSHYAGAALGRATDPAPLQSALAQALADHADGPRVLILRDYHAENLLWLPEREGIARLGLLDFQLAQLGQPGYDLVSLLQDARRDVAPATEAEMISRFAAARGQPEVEFRCAYAVLGVQRALRILGIFTRLAMTAGKTHYLRLVPRVWRQLQRNLDQPELAELRQACRQTLPDPTPETLQRIEAQCGNSR